MRARNIAFVIWLIGADLCSILGTYVNEYLLNQKYSDSVTLSASIVWIFFYIYVATKLYEKN